MEKYAFNYSDPVKIPKCVLSCLNIVKEVINHIVLKYLCVIIHKKKQLNRNQFDQCAYSEKYLAFKIFLCTIN